MSRLRCPQAKQPSSPLLVRGAVAALFPRVPSGPALRLPRRAEEPIPAVTLEELKGAQSRIKERSAPGPDGIPNSALKIAIAARPDIFLRVYTMCLETGVFPSGWKRQRLVLLPKPGKPPDEPSSYRPLCMLDTAGKILERIICDRLEAFTERPGGLSERQYGFRKGRSTIDAIEDVISTAREAIAGKRWYRGTKKYCAVVTLDVQLGTVGQHPRRSTPFARTRLLAENNRRLLLGKSARLHHGRRSRVLQSHSRSPTGVSTGPDPVERYCEARSRLSAYKRLTTRRRLCSSQAGKKRKPSPSRWRPQHTLVPLHPLPGPAHRRQAEVRPPPPNSQRKGSRVIGALAKIMPNSGGPRSSQRKLYAHVVDSILLYGAPVWCTAAQTRAYIQQAESAHRRACLRVIGGRPHVAYEATYVLAGIPPLALLADERARL
ncbi:unnamed protein product [Trichogramma brassicae]|uniref:Reverse transcriptase domain-containing protein n=1 Tax=Trichogramma brassicae TaxID=86971 RepID=A0A6H5IC98_9HYME|nr:unnamed protein product [Trichogramma brassicae]